MILSISNDKVFYNKFIILLFSFFLLNNGYFKLNNLNIFEANLTLFLLIVIYLILYIRRQKIINNLIYFYLTLQELLFFLIYILIFKKVFITFSYISFKVVAILILPLIFLLLFISDYVKKKLINMLFIPLSDINYSKYIYIKKIINKIGKKKITEIYYIDSNEINAFYVDFLFSKHKYFFFTKETLKKNKSFIGLMTIHELGHVHNKHYIKKNLFLIFRFIVIVIYSIACYKLLKNKLNFITTEITIKVFIGLLILQLFMIVLDSFLSRKNEYEADEYVVKRTLNVEDYIKFLNSLKKPNKWNKSHFNFLKTHPTIEERIKKNKEKK